MPGEKNGEAFKEFSGRLARLEKRKASGWEKTKTVGAILTPIAVVVIGYFIQSILTAQQHALAEELEEARAAREREANKVRQAQLISHLMVPLLSEDPRERMLAINIVLHACEDAGWLIVSSVSETDPDEAVRRHARESMEQRRKGLVQQLGHSHREVRQDAVEKLAKTWRDDPELPKEIVQYAKEHEEDATIMHNVTSVMTHLSRQRLRANRRELLPLLDRAQEVGPKTRDRAQKILRQLD